MNTSPDMPSSRPMTPYTIGVDFAHPDTMTLRQHTKLTDEILEVIDQQPLNRYEVALRLTRWAENYGQEIAREARLAGMQEITTIGRERLDNDDMYSLDAFIEDAEVYLDKLTQKPPQDDVEKYSGDWKR